MIKKKAVFLDRDGTINYDYKYVHKFSNFKFRPNVVKGLRFLCKNKYLIFVVTNKAGIAKGKFKVSDLKILHKKLLNYLKKRKVIINDIEYCPFHPKGIVKKYKKKSPYRKPGYMMFKKIIKKWQIDIKKSFMLGDSKKDELAAKKTKLYFEYVKNDFYLQVKKISIKISQ